MKFIPILFSTAMVQSILADLKNQTRRTQGLEEINKNPDAWNIDGNPMRTNNRVWDSTIEENPNPLSIEFGFRSNDTEEITYVKSKTKPGDIFWVRETWRKVGHYGFEYLFYQYKAGGTSAHCEIPDPDQILHDDKWKPSIFMPKEACRLFLEVTEVRIERLQDISDDDALSEGVRFDLGSGYFFCGDDNMAQSATKCFAQLWFQINGVASWNANPWVWVYTLKRVNRPSTFN